MLDYLSHPASLHAQPFPKDYNEAIRQAQNASTIALNNGAKLLEVDIPAVSLSSVSGDADGTNEMNYSCQHLRQFCRMFQDEAVTTRIFFPDSKELEVARQGTVTDPNAGSWASSAVFGSTKFKLDYLSTPNGLLDLGISFGKADVAGRVQSSDKVFVIAYPHFDPREMIAVEELYQKSAKESERPIIVFNGELDRIRSGYYPPLFYPKIGQLAKTFIPKFETVYYIHNFKGAGGGVLFRAYPEDWQVLCRNSMGATQLVHTQQEMPTLREVQLEILPKVLRAMRR